ncbi:tyrosine-type recombinase/integrase [Alistipes sp.]|uniref:tyrosine-type recombinase/integrase n=1 Tax=Alistipes sp. TaxID=1872444 RepID=UPI003AB63260
MFKYKQNDIGQLRFSLRNSKEATTMIRARITIKGQRMIYFLPVDYKVKPLWWDTKLGMVKTEAKTNPDVKGNPSLKNYLENVNAEIRRTHNTLMEVIESLKTRNVPYTADVVKEELVMKLKPDSIRPTHNVPRDLIGYMTYYIGLCEDGTIQSAGGTKLGAGTIRAYYGTLAALRKFCSSTRTKPTIDTLSMEFYHSFIRHLNSTVHSRGHYTQNTIGKFIKCIKAALRYAYEMGYTTNTIYTHRDFKIPSGKTEEVYLNDEELDILYALSLPQNKAHVRDAFILACDTGVRHSDLEQLNDTHINIHARKITIHSIKTGTKSVIPINSRVLKILNRYGSHMPPVPANAVMNREIKTICKDAGFTQKVNILAVRGGEKVREVKEKWELISCHTARRSFATNLANKGISMMDLQNLTGHSSEGNLRRYLRTTKEEIADKLINETEYFK